MHAVHVDLATATFCQEAIKLQCQATTRVMILSRAVGHEEVSVNADTLNSLGLFYRVARPLRFVVDISVDDSVEVDEEEGVNVVDLIAKQITLAQFWSQLKFAVTGIEASSDQNIPFHLQIGLDLEHTDYNASSSEQGQTSNLNVNDINCPSLVPKAKIDRIVLALEITSQLKQKPNPLHGSGRRVKHGESREAHHHVTSIRSNHLLEIVDAGLRSSVSSSRQRLAPGVKRKGVFLKHTLQSLFPAVFSPSGFQYIAERRSLIPGISRSLLSCLGRSNHAQQASRELVRSSGLQHYNQQIQPEASQNATFDSVEVLLWDTLTHSARHSQRRAALESTLQTPDLSRTRSALLSERLTKSTATHNFNQSEDSFGTIANELLFNYASKGYQLEGEAPDWLEIEALLDEARNNCLASQDESIMHEAPFQAKQHDDEQDNGNTRHEQDEEMFGETRVRQASQEDNALLFGSSGLLEDKIFDICRQQEGQYNSYAGSPGSMLIGGTGVPSQTLHEAYEELHLCIMDDMIGCAVELSQKDTRISPPKEVFTNWKCAHPTSHDPPEHHTINEHAELDLLSTPKPYLSHGHPDLDAAFAPQLERYSISPALLPEHLPYPNLHFDDETQSTSSSEDDLFLITPPSTQESMPSFQDLHRQTISKTPTSEPTLEELLGDDKGLWGMWQRRGSLGLQSGTIRAMYEADPDMKLISSGPWKRSSSSESMEDNTIQRPASAYTKATSAKQTSPRNSLSKRSSTSSSTSSNQAEKRHSLFRRLSKSSKASSNQEMLDFDFSMIQDRDVEVKRRKTLDDYDGADHEMLFN